MHNQKLLVQETHLEQLLGWMLASEITARIDKEYLQFNDAKDDLKDNEHHDRVSSVCQPTVTAYTLCFEYWQRKIDVWCSPDNKYR